MTVQSTLNRRFDIDLTSETSSNMTASNQVF